MVLAQFEFMKREVVCGDCLCSFCLQRVMLPWTLAQVLCNTKHHISFLFMAFPHIHANASKSEALNYMYFYSFYDFYLH